MGVPSTTEMARRHEEHAAGVVGGTRNRGSGNQWQAQTDGGNAPDDRFGFRLECKATKGASLTITLAMIAKIKEQAQGHRWAIPLRWYANERLTSVAAELWAIEEADFSELLDAARELAELQAALGPDMSVPAVLQALTRAGEAQGERDRLREELAAATQALEAARTVLDDPGPAVPPSIPQLPWTVVYQWGLPNSSHLSRQDFTETGHVLMKSARTAVVERSLGNSNRPRLIVDNLRVPDGDLYRNGQLIARVCAADPSIEVG